VKVIVKDNYLNVRMGRPSVNARCIQYLSPGSEIEVDGQLYPGDAYQSISTWYKDELNNYYWSGGVEGPPSAKKTIGEWWISDYGIAELWTYTKGKGIKVAVLDSGIGINSDINREFVTGYNFFEDNDNYSDITNGHGTHIIGIIAAQGKKVNGIAPGVSIYAGRITDNSGKVADHALIKALKKCMDLKVDIINLSLAITPADYNKSALLKAELPGLIKQITNEKQIFIIAACGNYAMPLDCYPACLPDSIAVSAVDEKLEIYESACESNAIKVSAPGVNIFSTLLNDLNGKLSGTSQAAGYVTGLIALFKSYMVQNGKWNYKSLVDQLSNPANLKKTGGPKQQYGNGIVDPIKIFNAIK